MLLRQLCILPVHPPSAVRAVNLCNAIWCSGCQSVQRHLVLAMAFPIPAPLDLGKRRNRCDWKSKLDDLGDRVEKVMGPWITPGSCWMSKSPKMSFSGCQFVQRHVVLGLSICTAPSGAYDPTQHVFDEGDQQRASSGSNILQHAFLEVCEWPNPGSETKVDRSRGTAQRIPHPRNSIMMNTSDAMNIDYDICRSGNHLEKSLRAVN